MLFFLFFLRFILHPAPPPHLAPAPAPCSLSFCVLPARLPVLALVLALFTPEIFHRLEAALFL